jgi:glucosamine--fructose-6-phosphate aminotransferase (isomerizing)
LKQKKIPVDLLSVFVLLFRDRKQKRFLSSFFVFFFFFTLLFCFGLHFFLQSPPLSLSFCCRRALVVVVVVVVFVLCGLNPLLSSVLCLQHDDSKTNTIYIIIMCGIFAYLNCGVPKTKKEIVEKLLVGLKRLEYRGYDSAGFAMDDNEKWCEDDDDDDEEEEGGDKKRHDAKKVIVCREVGKIANLEALARKELFGEDDDDENEVKASKSKSSNGRKKSSSSIKPLDFCASIAHTRWATHGPPNKINTHPHTSDSRENEFVVVHNGIITNHAPLRAMLERRGMKFETDTDTEVIPKLCKFLSDKFEESGEKDVTFRQLAMEVTRQLQGAYALVFKSTKYPGELVAAKRGSPLLMGISDDSGEVSCVIDGNLSDGAEEDVLLKKASGNKKRKSMTGGAAAAPAADADTTTTTRITTTTTTTTTTNNPKVEFYFASDASAMVEHTKRVLVLEDDDVCHCHDGTYKIYKVEKQKHPHPGYTSGHDSPEYGLYKPVVLSKEVERTIETLEMEVESIMKGEFDHFMQKEIFEQPEAISSTMRGRLVLDVLGAAERVMLGGMSQFAATIRRSRRIILCGCGTSYNSAIAIRQLFEELTELPVTLELASDVLDRRCPFFRDDTCIFISQSGETADTLKALEYAKAKGALCVGIVNTVGSAISRATDCGVHINAGAEIGVASTKAYTCQIVAMVLVALSLSEDSRSKHTRRDDIMQGLLKLPGCVKECLKMDAILLELAQELKEEHSLLIFGRGFNYATALEGALKVKEVALVHSEGILAGEMKHGPLALVDKHMPIIVVCTNDGSYEKQQSVVQQLKARDGRLILIVSDDDTEMEKTAPDAVILRVPKVEDCLQAVVNIVPLQLLSYHLTVLRGHNCDQPRNLAKSVTVE